MPVSQQSDEATPPGVLAPSASKVVSLTDTAVPLLTGEGTLDLEAYRGQVVLLDFWATWSAPSRSERAALAQLYDDLQASGFTLIGLCVDGGSLDQVRAEVAALDLPYPVGRADEAVMKAYGGVRVIPTKILLDRAGRIRQTYAGIEDMTRLRADIAALLAH